MHLLDLERIGRDDSYLRCAKSSKNLHQYFHVILTQFFEKHFLKNSFSPRDEKNISFKVKIGTYSQFSLAKLISKEGLKL